MERVRNAAPHCLPASRGTQASPSESRPYRSHKFPACARCRIRKLRCIIDSPGQSCELCQKSNSACTLPQPTPKLARRSRRSVNRSHQNLPVQSTSEDNSATPQLRLCSSNDGRKIARTSMIVGPMTAEDVQSIQRYMSSQSGWPSSKDSTYRTVSDNPRDPILYRAIPKRMPGWFSDGTPGEKQREIIEQILGPFVDEVVSLYFTHHHPAFPILDQDQFLQLHKSRSSDLSPALVCQLLATSLVFWDRSPTLRSFPRPNQLYVWNQAVQALQEEFLEPGMSTVCAVLLDLGGRPTTSITGNTLNSGRTVALAHTLGLNRDPSSWGISEVEKSTRIRLWWGVLIHDRWSSFAHGVPTQIVKDQYEVPLPTVASLSTTGEVSMDAANGFIALCMLTEILGDVLPVVYSCRQSSSSEAFRVLRRLELRLDDWEDTEPAASALRRGTRDDNPVSGASSLKLGYLAIRMLIHRLSFRSATHSDTATETLQYSQKLLREAAREITTFMTSLKPQHLTQFWMPYTAYHLASATIILLRCSIDSDDLSIKEACRVSLTTFIDWLQWAKRETNWDLADICLAQCEVIIRRMFQESTDADGDEGLPDPFTLLFDRIPEDCMGPLVTDTQNNVDGFAYPWLEIWDAF